MKTDKVALATIKKYGDGLNTTRTKNLKNLQKVAKKGGAQAKKELAKQGVHAKDIAETTKAEEIGEAIQEREDLKTVLTWSERKETYTNAQDHLSQIFETEADPESGKAKKLEVKQFEAVVGTLMQNPKVKATIQAKIEAGDKRVI